MECGRWEGRSGDEEEEEDESDKIKPYAVISEGVGPVCYSGPPMKEEDMMLERNSKVQFKR